MNIWVMDEYVDGPREGQGEVERASQSEGRRRMGEEEDGHDIRRDTREDTRAQPSPAQMRRRRDGTRGDDSSARNWMARDAEFEFKREKESERDMVEPGRE